MGATLCQPVFESIEGTPSVGSGNGNNGNVSGSGNLQLANLKNSRNLLNSESLHSKSWLEIMRAEGNSIAADNGLYFFLVIISLSVLNVLLFLVVPMKETWKQDMSF